MQYLPDALAPFAAYRQFIVYILVPSTGRPGKMDKLPVDCNTGRVANAHDANIWTDVATAIAFVETYGPQYGVGFVFTRNDPFFFLDIDNCLEPSGQWSTLAQQLCAAFPGAAIEVSNSGRGLHIFGTGLVPAHGCKNTAYGLEFYTEARFAALTGTGAVGSALMDFSDRLPNLVAQFFPPGTDSEGGAFPWTEAPCDGWRGPADDEVLLERAIRSQSGNAAFGNRASFADLFNGNVEALARAYPDSNTPPRPYDGSSADAALAQHLAFWTGKDCERMHRLMMRSALVRDKWQRDDYLRKFTIPNACARQRDVLTDKLPEPVPNAPTAGYDEVTPVGEPPQPKLVTGSTFLSIDEQINMFRGCVYVVDQNRALVPGGVLLKPDQFRVVYGGYTMSMDNANARESRDAWECFTQSQSFRAPRADGTTFRPDRPSGELIRDAGRTRVNVWWPIETPRKVGDAGPFLRHLAKVLPDERDRQILLAYMAACVQHKGVKFQWAPLLQGAEGNGKTLFTRCVAEAVGRRYTHWPKASQLATPFNAWLLYKVFIGVEDIYVPDSKREVIEELKPMITGGDGLEIQAKGIDQISADICANFMFNSNHKDAIRKTRNDRRFGIFYTAQQTADDVISSGMGGDYFPNLYTWLRAEGYAIVSELLHTMPIPSEFNPAGACQRAPMTSTTEQAIEAGLGSIEQEVREAIEQGEQGFRGGWVSSMALDVLLETLNASRRVPINKRRELLMQLGYDYHPGLKDGRVNNTLLPDGGKPRLFIKNTHPHRALIGASEIGRAYSAAQGFVPVA